MRHKRAKAYRKLMSLYAMSFGFRQPYQVLVDSHMAKEASAHKIELVKQLGVVLQGTVKPMITQCCIQELYLEEKDHPDAVALAKTFERRKCNHRTPIPGDECLRSVVAPLRARDASTDLRSALRAIPAVPIVHLNRAVMILEPPSDATLHTKALAEENALRPSEPETQALQSAAPAPAEPPRKKKGPKGPNPLSVKKKKPKVDAGTSSKPQSETNNAGEKRKREVEGLDDGEQHTEGSGHQRKRRRRHAKSEPKAV
ncbi:PIN domain-like protein [Epithele typhae]|uniref:PIN domain-like protein n=1 Tax=Epithele typhae TaxID=378194 RepID=UPI002008DA1A|nr:PIN domain-like protein [Epithele typhae]KAH9944452.1 PIN domain-like protein [Epithele typhae]